jgi:uncharacterized membrane protein YhaH (DUF805 family)
MHLLFSFNGRIGRGKYFGGLLINTVLVMAAYAVIFLVFGVGQQMAAQSPDQISPMVYVTFAPVSIISAWIGFALAAKRFHDMGVTGWLSLLLLIPLVGFIVVLVLLFKGGEDRDNQYGPVPA